MLSPGKFHLEVPADPEENARFRLAALELADESEDDRRLLLEMCREDWIFWVNVFAVQYNPENVDEEIGPFVLYPKQEEIGLGILSSLRRRRGRLFFKSRFIGGTWVYLLVQTWVCLFHQNKNFIDISHSADAVDVIGNPNCLFYKIDFIHKNLPDWMRRSAHHPKQMDIQYPGTNSSVAGYATTKRGAVGGRATGQMMDEHGLNDRGQIVRTNMTLIGPQVIVSAHYGQTGDLFTLWDAARKGELPGFDVSEMHWTDHPVFARGLYSWDQTRREIVIHDKDYDFPADYPFVREPLPLGGYAPGMRSPWYDQKCNELKHQQAIACQLDMDPTGASNLVFDRVALAEHKRRHVVPNPPAFVGRVEYDPATHRVTGLKPDPKGPLTLWLELRDGRPPPMKYFAGADIASGSGGPLATPTCMSVLNQYGQKVAAFVATDMEPRPFAHLAVALCKFFADPDGTGAFFAWEIPGYGVIVSKVVLEIGYLNIYMQKRKPGAVWSEKDSDVPGWVNNPQSKRELILNYATALAEGRFVNPCPRALEECEMFEWGQSQRVVHSREINTTDPSQAGVNHGDRVMADAITLMAAEPYLTRREVREVKQLPVNLYGSQQGLELLFQRQHRDKQSVWVRR